MNKAVELITKWGAFDARHPESSIEDFCRHYLSEKATATNDQKSGWAGSVSIDFALMRLIGRMYKLHSFYASRAMAGTDISSSEEFSLLNAIDGLGEPRKKDAITRALFEQSTGSDMLNRLKKIGYISEYPDAEDGRSRRIKITPKGYKALKACRRSMEQLAGMQFHDLTADEKKICLQLLGGIDQKYSSLWQSHKDKSFEEIYQAVIQDAAGSRDI